MPYQQPYKQEFTLPDGTRITSVVLDEIDFHKLCVALTQAAPYNAATGGRDGPNESARHIPLIKRGTRTKIAFDMFGVETDIMSAIVRGHGRELFNKMVVGMLQGNQ